MSMLRQTLRSALALSIPRKWLLVRGPASAGVCLTFDDGPHPEYTPRILDALRDHGITATFFVVGEQAQKHPELVRRIAVEGHALGHHSYFHTEPSLTSIRKLVAEIAQTSSLLTDILGTNRAPTRLFRPPKGELTPGKLLALRRLGMTVVLWNVDPRDYKTPSAADLVEWFHKHPLNHGDIVLLHDVKPHAADIIGDLADHARQRGLEFTQPLAWKIKPNAAKVAAL